MDFANNLRIWPGISAAILVCGGLAICAVIWKQRERRINFGNVVSAAMLFQFGMGALVAIIASDDQDWRNLTIKYQISTQSVVVGSGLILLAASVLGGVGHLAREWCSVETESIVSGFNKLGEAGFIADLVIAALALLVFRGVSLNLAGSYGAGFEGTRRSFLSMVLFSAGPMIAVVATCRVLVARSLLSKVLGLPAVLLTIPWFGRFNGLVVIGISVLTCGLTGFISRRLFLALVIPATLSLALLWQLQFGLRSVRQQNPDVDLTSQLRLAGNSMFFSKSEHSDLGIQNKRNLSTRTYYLFGYACYIADAAGSMWGKGDGRQLFYSAMMAVPSSVSKVKDQFTENGAEEGMAMDLYSIVQSDDDANSLVTSAILDLGYVGILIYSLISILILSVAVVLHNNMRVHLIRLALFCFLLKFCVGAEGTYAGWFLALRFVAFLFVIDILFSLFVGRQPVISKWAIRPNKTTGGNSRFAEYRGRCVTKRGAEVRENAVDT